MRQPKQRIPAQGLDLKELPLFECRTVLQVKALQEICLVETGCFLQCLPAGRAQVLSISIPFMMMLAKLFQARVKILYIQADGKIGMETDLILGNQKGIFAQQCLEARQTFAEIGPCNCLTSLLPEQSGECIAAMGLGCDEQVDQERQIFPALYFDGFFPAFDLRLAKESDAQILHRFIIHAGEARASFVRACQISN